MGYKVISNAFKVEFTNKELYTEAYHRLLGLRIPFYYTNEGKYTITLKESEIDWIEDYKFAESILKEYK